MLRKFGNFAKKTENEKPHIISKKNLKSTTLRGNAFFWQQQQQQLGLDSNSKKIGKLKQKLTKLASVAGTKSGWVLGASCATNFFCFFLKHKSVTYAKFCCCSCCCHSQLLNNVGAKFMCVSQFKFALWRQKSILCQGYFHKKKKYPFLLSLKANKELQSSKKKTQSY